MRPTVAVLALSEAFERVWPELAESVGAGVRTVASVEELGPPADACGVIVAAGGVEAAAEEAVREAHGAGVQHVAVVGAGVDHRLAMRLAQAGAADCFNLPAEMELLRSWVAERVDRSVAGEHAAALTDLERRQHDFSALIGESEPLRAALCIASKVIGRSTATVLITGETGTGKELLAQAIHYNGPRASQPFVEINCTALPTTLLEAELFGYEKGAFTDARAAKPGLFEAAHRGTVFLDEIGDLSPELQAKLLKVLEDHQVRRLGSVRSFQVDVRIITATHQDLSLAVAEGRFRRDLFYRLNVVPIRLPALRDRGDDILRLADHFLDRFSEEYDLARPAINAACRHALRAHSWPGNVRELRNAIERAVLLGDGALRAEDLFLDAGPPRPDDDAAGPIPFPATLEQIEHAVARAMLERAEGNKSAAAVALGISRARLYRLLEPPAPV